MTAASSICRIRLSCSTTGPTSNWKALAIAVLLRPGDSQISRRLILPGFERPATSERPRLTHGPLGEEAERCKRRGAGAALVWNNRETEMGDLAEIEALFFALIGGSPGAEVVFLNQNLAVRCVCGNRMTDRASRARRCRRSADCLRQAGSRYLKASLASLVKSA